MTLFIKVYITILVDIPLHFKVVGLGRLELPTSPLSGVRSNQLSYKPISSIHLKNVVELSRIELLTSCVQGRRSPS